MIIPEKVNFTQFFIAATEQGVKINSRFKGVYIKYDKRKKTLHWMCECWFENKLKFIGNYPFTLIGERTAAKAYEDFVAENSLIKRKNRNKNPVKP